MGSTHIDRAIREGLSIPLDHALTNSSQSLRLWYLCSCTIKIWHLSINETETWSRKAHNIVVENTNDAHASAGEIEKLKLAASTPLRTY